MNRDEFLSGGAYQTAKHGEDLPWAKLNAETVKQIRRQHERKQKLIDRLNERYSAEAFAERLGVHKNTVVKALAYATWRQVK